MKELSQLHLSQCDSQKMKCNVELHGNQLYPSNDITSEDIVKRSFNNHRSNPECSYKSHSEIYSYNCC